MVHEQLVAGIKQLNADEGYIDSTSFPATPAPSPFSPSPAQVSQFSPDQVAEGIQRLREEATREERSGSIVSSTSGLVVGRLATASGINNAGHVGTGISSYVGMGIAGYGFGGSSGTSTGQPPTPSSTPGPPGLAAAAIAHHQLGVIPEHLAESIQRNLRPTDEGLESTSSPGTPVPTPISPSMSHQMQHQSNLLPEQLVAGIHRLKETEGMSSGGSSALPSTPAPTPFSHHPGGVRPEDLAAGISRLSVIEEGDVQQQQSIAINISAHESVCSSDLSTTSPIPKLSQYFTPNTVTTPSLADTKNTNNHSKKHNSSISSGGEQFFDLLQSQTHSASKLDESHQGSSSSVLQSCRESRVDLSSTDEDGQKIVAELASHGKISANQGNSTEVEACLDVVEQAFDDARSLQRRTSQEQLKQNNRSRNESSKTEDEEEPKLCTFFTESQDHLNDKDSAFLSNPTNKALPKENDPFDTIAETQQLPKPKPPTSLETPKFVKQHQTSNYSTPVAPTPTTISSMVGAPLIPKSAGVKESDALSYSTYSNSIPASATPLLQPAIPKFDPTQPIRSPLPLGNSNSTQTKMGSTYVATLQDSSARCTLDSEIEGSYKWNRSESAWIASKSTAQSLASITPGTTPDR